MNDRHNLSHYPQSQKFLRYYVKSQTNPFYSVYSISSNRIFTTIYLFVHCNKVFIIPTRYFIDPTSSMKMNELTHNVLFNGLRSLYVIGESNRKKPFSDVVSIYH